MIFLYVDIHKLNVCLSFSDLQLVKNFLEIDNPIRTNNETSKSIHNTFFLASKVVPLSYP